MLMKQQKKIVAEIFYMEIYIITKPLNQNKMNNEINMNYTIGDKVCSYHNPDKIIGTCTGFVHNNTCIEIDGKCWGGKSYFLKADFEDVDYEIITDISLDENDIKKINDYVKNETFKSE